ncbi:PspC domain-containing protein [Candidatus Albibeggiatoa sp. nov. BB20]|uniref:PspC domain-containing protein n=1 Tax=Candidatus Albibeggiatoa sp. nov. BB20 TaxID=3162723 RepID=UPI0033654726
MKIKSVLYRNSQQGKLFGVCAGWAEFLQQDVGVIRTLVIIFGLFPLTSFITIASYIVMSLMLEDKSPEPEKLVTNSNPTELLNDIETQLNGLETKIVNLENYVISEAFEFQCKLWTLKSGK